MADYLVEVQKMEKYFDGFEVRYVPRLDNKDVDHLAWIASSRSPIPEDVILEKLVVPSAATTNQGLPSQPEPEVMIIDAPNGDNPEEDWRIPIKDYLESELLPDDSPEAQRMKRQTKLYALIDGELYKKGLSGMLMKCILRDEGKALLQDIDGGICGAHNSFRTIIGKDSDMGFIGQRRGKMLLNSSRLVRIVNSFRSRPRCMPNRCTTSC